MIAALLALCLWIPNEAAARAEAHFAAGEYEQAIAALHDAYAFEPDPKFVFAEGSALQELGRYAEAIAAYQRFIEIAPSREQAEKAIDRIRACRESMPPPPEQTPVVRETEPTAEVAAATPLPSAVTPSAPADRPWHRDPAGGALLGMGVASAITGGVLVGVGAARHRRADDAATEDAFRGELRGSVTLQGVGIGLAITGGALVVGGIIRYAIVRRRS